MKYILYVVLGLSLILASCGPIYKTSYEFSRPNNSDVEICVKHCLKVSKNCKTHCASRNQLCRLNNNRAFLGYGARTANVGRRVCHFDCGCDDSYRQCYIDCGGKVIEHKECQSFCG